MCFIPKLYTQTDATNARSGGAQHYSVPARHKSKSSLFNGDRGKKLEGKEDSTKDEVTQTSTCLHFPLGRLEHSINKPSKPREITTQQTQPLLHLLSSLLESGQRHQATCQPTLTSSVVLTLLTVTVTANCKCGDAHTDMVWM